MTYKIEKNIPIRGINRKTKPAKYPWREMEVGDSFFVDNFPRQKTGHLCSYAAVVSKRYAPKKFIQRPEGNGVRFWRVE